MNFQRQDSRTADRLILPLTPPFFSHCFVWLFSDRKSRDSCEYNKTTPVGWEDDQVKKTEGTRAASAQDRPIEVRMGSVRSFGALSTAISAPPGYGG